MSIKKKLRKFVRDVRNKVLHTFGLLTHRYRQVPDFLIIGTQKGGTSSLFFYLKFHPSIKRPFKKEIHYFNIFFERGLKWYMAHFPFKSSNHLTGEASPDYIFHPDTPERVKALNPKMKLILLVRNPIQRAYSAYQMNRRMGIDPRESFTEAIEYELDNQEKFTDIYNYERHNYFYLERGKYAQQLAKWMEVFDKEQLKVIESDYFFKETNRVLKSIYTFLNIEEKLPPTLRPMNVGKYPPLSEEVYESLKDYYKQDAALLKADWNIEF